MPNGVRDLTRDGGDYARVIAVAKPWYPAYPQGMYLRITERRNRESDGTGTDQRAYYY